MEIDTMAYKLSSAGISDIGLVRQNNEDVWAQLPKKKFYVLADGMGGHKAGEVAAREAVAKLVDIIDNDPEIASGNVDFDEARLLINHAIQEANNHVFKLGRQDPELRGMGTTLCCLYFHPEGLVYAHVGDSRIYRLRHKKLQQMTKDHSLLREMLELGQLDEQQAGDFHYKNIITKAVGTEAHVHPSVRLVDVLDQDIYLICSDGLSDMVSKEEIESILSQKNTPKEMSEKLVALANKHGGNDNITVVIVKVQGPHEKGKDLSR